MVKIIIALLFTLFTGCTEGDWNYSAGDIVLLKDSSEVVILREERVNSAAMYRVKNIKTGMELYIKDKTILNKIK